MILKMKQDDVAYELAHSLWLEVAGTVENNNDSLFELSNQKIKGKGKGVFIQINRNCSQSFINIQDITCSDAVESWL
jgi:hypothetical protein